MPDNFGLNLFLRATDHPHVSQPILAALPGASKAEYSEIQATFTLPRLRQTDRNRQTDLAQKNSAFSALTALAQVTGVVQSHSNQIYAAPL